MKYIIFLILSIVFGMLGAGIYEHFLQYRPQGTSTSGASVVTTQDALYTPPKHFPTITANSGTMDSEPFFHLPLPTQSNHDDILTETSKKWWTLKQMQVSDNVFADYESNAYVLEWMPRTLEISGRYVSYYFGAGNPTETNRSEEELLALGFLCSHDPYPTECQGEFHAHDHGYIYSTGDIGYIIGKSPFRITPEKEHQILAFLAHPVISESSRLCGEHFYTKNQFENEFDPERKKHVSELATYMWDPYYININYWILVNPYTGRKEVNTRFIESLYAQIFTNTRMPREHTLENPELIACLEENSLLESLRYHVGTYHHLFGTWFIGGGL